MEIVLLVRVVAVEIVVVGKIGMVGVKMGVWMWTIMKNM